MPVEKIHWSLESQTLDLQVCDVGLAPLSDKRFTRGKCGFKILQYFACGPSRDCREVLSNHKGHIRHLDFKSFVCFRIMRTMAEWWGINKHFMVHIFGKTSSKREFLPV